MGVTLSSKNYSIDMGYIGFFNLRKKVAELVNQKLGEHYDLLSDLICIFDKTKRIEACAKYDEKTIEIQKEFKITKGIIKFLYKSDCNGSISFAQCKQIYKYIKDYDDNIIYGYCAMFKDFKAIIIDCVENKCSMKWR